VKQWSDDEFARRWWKLFPQRKDDSGKPAEPTDTDLGMIKNNSARIEEIRKRLSHTTWFRISVTNISISQSKRSAAGQNPNKRTNVQKVDSPISTDVCLSSEATSGEDCDEGRDAQEN